MRSHAHLSGLHASLSGPAVLHAPQGQVDKNNPEGVATDSITSAV